MSSSLARPRRIIRRNNNHQNPASCTSSTNNLPPHLTNNRALHHVISTTLPADYTFEILKTIHRIESLNARHVALQLPEGLLMYATCIGDILQKFSYVNLPSTAAAAITATDTNTNADNNSNSTSNGKTSNHEATSSKGGEPLTISILGDVTYGACCIDDLTAVSLNVDLLVHYGHSCLVPTTCSAVPCLYVFVEIRVDVGHLVDCVRLTFEQQGDDDSDYDGGNEKKKVVECAVMGTVQFRSAVVEAAQRLNRLSSVRQNSTTDQNQVEANTTNTISQNNKQFSNVEYQAIVPQAKPLSPGEVLGCTAPSGLATLNWGEAMMSPKEKREFAKKNKTKTDQESNQDDATNDTAASSPTTITERVMIFLADGRFHLEAAMISNPTLRALRYDPYSKTLTEEKYEIVKMKRLRRDAVLKVRDLLGVDNTNTLSGRKSYAVQHVPNVAAPPRNSEEIADSILDSYQGGHSTNAATTHSSSSIQNTTAISPRRTMGIILGTLGRQGNPGILGRIRSLLHKRGVRTMIVLLSEIFPKKLEMMSVKPNGNGRDNEHGVCAWVQIACPRLSIDWGHYFCVPVLSPFELFVALGEVADSSLWSANDDNPERDERETTINAVEEDGYPMDFYSKAGGPWTNYFDSNKDRRIVAYGD
eukprot:scaffold47941_cov22-Cyclotella_meneghiniana.AAC.1